MKIITFLALTLISCITNAAEPDQVHTGRIIKVSPRSLDLNQGSTNVVAIGFVVDACAAISLKKPNKGDEFRAVFGSTNDTNGNSI